MTDFCFSAFMGYDILKKLGGDILNLDNVV